MTDQPIETDPEQLARLGITLSPEAMRSALASHDASQATEAQAKLARVEGEYMALIKRRPESLTVVEHQRKAELKTIIGAARAAVGIPS